MIHDSRYRFVKAVGMLDKIGKYTCFIYVRVNFCPITCACFLDCFLITLKKFVAFQPRGTTVSNIQDRNRNDRGAIERKHFPGPVFGLSLTFPRISPRPIIS